MPNNLGIRIIVTRAFFSVKMLCVEYYINEGQGGSSQSNIMGAILVKKSLMCLVGKSTTPHWGSPFSLPFLPPTPSSQSQTLELTNSSRALNLASCIAFESQLSANCQLCYTWHGVASTKSGTTDANLNCKFAKKHLFTPILDCEKLTE